MTANEIVTIISSLGFPIFCCLALGYYVKTQTDSYRNDVKELQNQHKEEITKVTEAWNNNTFILQKLVDKIDNMNNN